MSFLRPAFGAVLLLGASAVAYPQESREAPAPGAVVQRNAVHSQDFRDRRVGRDGGDGLRGPDAGSSDLPDLPPALAGHEMSGTNRRQRL